MSAYGNSDAVPFDRLFYAGGSNSMRGWAPRTLGPGASPAPTDVVYPTQLGDMKLEANLEFRFPIWDMFHGATFLDLGNIWYIGRKDETYPEGSVFHFNSFYKQLAFNTGIGIRLDIDFAILRLDWGIQLHNPNNPVGERWIHNFKWRNTSLNFGVGFPF
jgi:outer membrane protein assembly factor BamA